jgi:WhiB family redox-sensing transcriptional regulator
MFDTASAISHHRASATDVSAAADPDDVSKETHPDRPAGTEGEEATMFALLNDESFTDDWWALAACRDGEGSLARVFFSEELQDIARAKEICAGCPAMVPCLEGAAARREPWGVWGGQLFLNGRVLTTKRRRGRPPKIARPEDQLPEIPIPLELQDKVRLRAS